MEHLLKRNVLPIVNENDTIATEEIVIGDNDNLGAILAKNIHAIYMLSYRTLVDCMMMIHIKMKMRN